MSVYKVVPALGIVQAHLLDDDASDEVEDEDDNYVGKQLTLTCAHRDTYANNFYAAYQIANYSMKEFRLILKIKSDIL